MTTTVLREIEAFLLGRRYYVNVVAKRWNSDDGRPDTQISNIFFSAKEDAVRYGEKLEATNRSYRYVETVSFRSRQDYPTVKG